jgi:hypothetical protein
MVVRVNKKNRNSHITDVTDIELIDVTQRKAELCSSKALQQK